MTQIIILPHSYLFDQDCGCWERWYLHRNYKVLRMFCDKHKNRKSIWGEEVQ